MGCKAAGEAEMLGKDRTFVEIDLAAVVANMEAMRKNTAPGTKMAAVIKTDGYGHGARQIAAALEPLPYVWGFCTATFDEAAELREAGIQKPVLILGYTFPDCYEQEARLGIRPAVFREDQLEALSAAAGRAGTAMPIHLAVDTGMSRIGIMPDDAGLSFVKRALETKNLIVEGIFTHFSKADMLSPDPTMTQAQAFRHFTDRIERELGYRVPIRHCDNSAGLIRFPENDMDLVRAGITVYGLWPSDEVPQDIVPLRPALSWYSTVVYVKDLPAGRAVSYGGTFVTERTTRVATVSVGYGDGYPRSLSNKGYVLIRGKRAPILGRICMDQLMADVSDIPGAAEGDRVTLIGTDGEETITCEALGDLSGRFNYELVCDIGKRVPRIYRQAQTN